MRVSRPSPTWWIAAGALVWVGAIVAGVARAGEQASEPASKQIWHPTLEAGLDGAKKSQKPLLVVTVWKTGV